jgi:transcriptional regulator with XRE-family HTH domain
MPFENDRILELRQSLGLTQSEFASLLGVPDSTVSRWERGEVQPSCKHLSNMYDLGIEYGEEPEFFAEPSDSYSPPNPLERQ